MKTIRSETVFSPGAYEMARIPGIVSLPSGELIVYCELRQSDSDWAVIDIGMRKIPADGSSFSELRILASGNGRDTVNNPLMIVRGDTLHFLYCVNYHRVFYMKSLDRGDSWSEPYELTDSIREQTGDFPWTCIATGPGHGIALADGTLLVPVWMAYNKEDEKSHHPSVIAVLYSRDSGESWKIGKISDELCDPSEFSVAQLPDGRVFANIRNEGEKKCRAAALVNNDFSIENIFCCEALPDPVCFAGFVSYKDGFLFSNCNSVSERVKLTLKRLSCDFTVTDMLLLSEKAGYSDIAVGADGKTVCVLAEREKEIELFVVEL